MSSLGTNIVVGASERTIYMYDVRNLAVPAQVRESPLKYQTSSVACNLNGDGFALGSVEGRVAIEYFDMDPSIQAKKYSFKCHRTAEAAYPVRAIAFHPVYGTFATGGCDGTVSLWDGANKKRLAQLRAYPTSIAALAFSHDGSTLAIASSYTYEEGEKEHPEDNIYLKPLDDAEIRPRTKV
jgi:cell cycle arrest protein BUB3